MKHVARGRAFTYARQARKQLIDTAIADLVQALASAVLPRSIAGAAANKASRNQAKRQYKAANAV